MSFLAGAQHTTITGGTQIAATAGSTVHYHQASGQEHGKARSELSAAAAHTAMHDSSARPNAPRCHRNTRVKYLDQLELWMLGEDEEFRETRLIWLNGGAGAGKSAIMQSIIERVARHGVVLGSFFFFRSDASRNYAEVLIPTLAYQLARAFPAATAVLEPVINRDPLIFKASLRTQAYELLVRPLLYLVDIGAIVDSSPRRNIFVIDGLDECSDPQKQMLIIQVVASVLCDYDVPVSFLIASRPEVAISSAFHREKRLYSMFASISLNDDDDAQSDIRQFIVDSFLDILEDHPHQDHIRMPWPHDYSIDDLVSRSSGHFIYAATAMRFIASADEHPPRALAVVEGLVPTRTSSPFAELDALYNHILTSAKYSTQALGILRHWFLSLYQPSFALICHIHGTSPDDASLFLSDVQSLVLLCPDSTAELTLKMNHASLRDFLMDESRSQGLYITREEFFASFLPRYFQLVGEGPRPPTSSFCFQERETRALMFNLFHAIRYSQDANLLQSVICGHSPQDIQQFCEESFAFDTPMLSSLSRKEASDMIRSYMRAIRDSVADTNNILYIQQFKMYTQLVLDDLITVLHKEPQYRIIPALMFSSSPSSLALTPDFLSSFGDQFRLSGSHEDYFRSLRDDHDGDVDHRSFEAIRSLPQSQTLWSSELAMAMKLVLQQLVKLSQTPDWLYQNRHRLLWVQRTKPSRRTLLGCLRQLPNPPLIDRNLHQILRHYGCSMQRAVIIHNGRRDCFLLLKAVIFYLHKSDSTSEVSKLARKSLPRFSVCFPKLMRRARADMDAYVLRWDESLDGILEKTQSLSVNDVD